MFKPVVSSPETLRQFLGYILIGTTVTAIDFGILATSLHFGVYRVLAVSVAYLAAGVTQFLLNKYRNFRSFDRSVSSQAGTYILVALAFWIATVAWVELCVRVFGLPTLVAKATFAPINVIGGFLAVRHLAFGRGIRKTLADTIQSKRGNAK